MRETPAGFALSLWSANKHRKNAIIAEKLSHYQVRTHAHYYFVGAAEENRSKMEEALIIQNGFATEKAPVLGGPFKDYHG